jgi:hypothetical protein
MLSDKIRYYMGGIPKRDLRETNKRQEPEDLKLSIYVYII